MRRVQLRFDEPAIERTQEFVLSWSTAKGGPSTEIIRQQWNFSPNGSITEIENHDVELRDLCVIELAVRPDISRDEDVASLSAFLVK